MRFILIAATALLGTALALPAAGDKREVGPDGACCCCDASEGAISCTHEIPPDQCICTLVACPSGAPTVWPDYPAPPTATPMPLPTPQDPPAERQLDEVEGGQTEQPGDSVGKLSTPSEVADGSQVDDEIESKFSGREEPADQEPCCCCNLAKGRVECEMREDDNCYCAKVMCPPEAPTVWPLGPEPTG